MKFFQEESDMAIFIQNLKTFLYEESVDVKGKKIRKYCVMLKNLRIELTFSETIDHSTPGKELSLEATWSDYQIRINEHIDLFGNGLFILKLNNDKVDFEGELKNIKIVDTLKETEDGGPYELHCFLKQASLSFLWKSYKIKIGNATDLFIEVEAEYDVVTFAKEKDKR